MSDATALVEAPAHIDATGLTSKYTRLTASHIAHIFRLSAQGVKQEEIARILGCHQSSVSRALQSFKQSEAEMRAQLLALTEDAADDWAKASKVAAERGDHRPARELIEAAHPKLRPQPVNSAGNGGGVVINIGAPGAPIRLPDIEISPEPDSLSPLVSLCKTPLTVDK